MLAQDELSTDASSCAGLREPITWALKHEPLSPSKSVRFHSTRYPRIADGCRSMIAQVPPCTQETCKN